MPNNDYANEPNQSRSEEIIQSILDNTEYDEEARSRIEYLLIELKNAIEGGGGGGGVTSYSPLTEKPKIDNHTLQAGNNTSSDLGLQTKIDADHKLSADVIDDTNSTNKFNVKSDWNAASGATSEILNKPTLGTASAKNVPATGDAATGEVVLGSDSRLTDARNAKDVYNWAKQENKPSYSYSEIQNTPTIPDELADLADDSTHRTVTDTEKTTWNGKQNALTFDNAPTSNSDNPVKSGGVYTALSAKQNNLSEAQLAAANSGATADKINKIAVNENNILLSEERNPMYNIFNFKLWANEVGMYRGTKTVAENSITLTATGNGCITLWSEGSYPIGARVSASAGDEVVLLWDSDNTTGTEKGGVWIFSNGLQTTGTYMHVGDNQGILQWTCPAGTTFLTFAFGVNTNGDSIKYSNIRLIPKSLYDAGFTDYQPYALSNAELTAKEQVNENNISSNTLNGGGINKFQVTATSTTINGITFTVNPDKTITATGSIADSSQNAIFTMGAYTAVSGDVLSEGLEEANPNAYVYARGGSTSLTNVPYKAILAGDIGVQRNYACVITAPTVGQVNITFKPMICNSDSYAKSGVYQPYALSNAELTEEVIPLTKGIKLVAHTSNNGNTSLSYDTNINDFDIGSNTDKNSGVYLIVCNNWSTTPAPYIGLLTFSGATTNHFVKTDVVTGFTPTISITENTANATIAISGAAKISIYAVR